jgi:uncharacterized membrane protein
VICQPLLDRRYPAGRRWRATANEFQAIAMASRFYRSTSSGHCDSTKLGERFMSKLAVIAYDDQFKAEEVRTKLRRLQQDHLIDLEQALVAVKDDQGEVTLLRMSKPAAEVEAHKGFWNTLVGAIVMEPALGMASDARSGAIRGALAGAGVDEDFLKELAATFQNGSSVLFVLIRHASPEQVLAALQGTGGKVLETNLTHQEEAKLQAALKVARAAG